MKPAQIRKLTLSAMFGALVFCATWLSIPTPFAGNINLGDTFLLLCAWCIGGIPGSVACAAGAALTDLAGGYAVYAPGTFVIKTLMGLTALGVLRLTRRLPALASRLISGIAAELVMIAGYYIYEAFVLSYGAVPSLANIPMNAIQGGSCLLIASLLYPVVRLIPYLKEEKQ